VCAEVEARFGSESIELARAQDLFVETLGRNGRSAEAGTLDLAKHVVAIKERLLGSDSLDVAVALDNLGDVYRERGESPSALPLHQRALNIRVHQLGDRHPAVADSLDRMGRDLSDLERFAEARQTLERARGLRERDEQDDPLALARTLEWVAWLNRNAGDFAAAAAALDQSVAMRQREAPTHPEIAHALDLRGDILFFQGDIAAAQRTWAEALGLEERTLRADHPYLAVTLLRLAVAAKAFGDLGSRRQLLERGTNIAERSMSACDGDRIALLNGLGLSLEYDGDYIRADNLFQRAQSDLEKCRGSRNSFTATEVLNQAEIAALLGDHARSERLYRTAIDLWSSALGPKHPYVARGLDALAEVLASSGRSQEARRLYDRALLIRRNPPGSDQPSQTPDVAWTLTNLAQIDANAGSFDLARKQLTEAIDIFRRVGVSDEPDHLARALTLLGDVQSRQGEFTAARSTFLDALAERQRIFGRSHPLTAASRADLAEVDFAGGSADAALAAALEAERDGRDQLRFTVRYLPERQAVAYSDKRPKGLDLALSVLAADRSRDPLPLLDSVIQSRAVILDELGARARTIVGADSELTSLNASLEAARQRFANLMLGSVGVGDSVSLAILNDARQQKEEAERAVAARSVAVQSELQRASVGVVDVRNALPANAALVAFVRYERTMFVPSGPRRVVVPRKIPSYIAFVLRADDVAAVLLGSTVDIDTLVGQWRDQFAPASRSASSTEAETGYRAAGAALRARIWDPLRGHLAGVDTVFVVPDGSLNLVAFSALPVGQTRYLIEQGPMVHYLSAERDLVTGESPSRNVGLLALGGAAFDDASVFATATKLRPTPVPSQNRTVPVTLTRSSSFDKLSAGCENLRSLQFPPLPGTRDEVQDIAKLWTDSPGEVLDGRAASERAFKRDAPGHRVVHLATHGFFLGTDCTVATAGTRSVGGLVSLQDKLGPRPQRRQVQSVFNDNPLLMSGLALAGANRRMVAGPSDEDGILTAEEVTALNLEGVEWVVLSACDTGLGAVKAGEGVFGLRRAFQMAGARTIIMSLWSVDDDATRVWMRALYQNRLQKHLSTVDSVHAASLGVLRARRARGQSTHPFYWAAFVAAGDWR
jgi:CHAT domain-containing protein/tetratricopeptide (TPR) repeat protein